MRSQAGAWEREEKVLGGTGILPVRCTGWKPLPPKAAGTEARPINFFMFYAWDKTQARPLTANS
jgi:hypothetical protein